MRGKNKKKTAIIMVVVIAAAGTAGGVFVHYQNAEGREIQQQSSDVTETQAKINSVSNKIVGTGNLETGEADSVKIPSGITISDVVAESGDYVSKGDVLAYADTASVLRALENVQSEIESVDEEIYELQEEDAEEEVAVKLDGRIKKIYISEGENTSNCILENGALMLLSSDGLLGVELNGISGEVEEGEEVTVTLFDGGEVSGIVERVNGNNCTVTITDSGIGMGETASVTNGDGEVLGTGVTYVHQPVEITGNPGIVSEICVSEDQAVSKGDVLFVVEREETAEYMALLQEREALADSMKELISLSENGEIKADTDGIIKDVYISGENEETSAEKSESTEESIEIQAANMSYQKGEVGKSTEKRSSSTSGFIMLSSVTYQETEDSSEVNRQQSMLQEEVPQEEVPQEEMPQEEMPQEEVPQEEVPQEEVPQEEVPQEEVPQEETPQEEPSKTEESITVENIFSEGLTIPETGAALSNRIQGADGRYQGNVSWNPGDETAKGGVIYQATVTLEAGEGYCFTKDSLTGISVGVISGTGLSDDGKKMTFLITFPETKKEEQNQQEEGTSEKENDAEDDRQSTSGGTMTGGTGFSGGSTSSGASVSSGNTNLAVSNSEEEAAESSEYSSDTTAFTIAGDEEMILSVSVDELDINSVEKGQKAEVTFDAIENETFEGTVTKVGNSASVNGGVAKYEVEISVPVSEKMKVGMNASATIVIENKENVITIPVSALQERGREVFVYTKKDEEGNLSGEQTVTTGLSDGEIVEITDGLSEGDVIYYQKKGGQDNSSGESNMPGGDMEAPKDFEGDFSGGMRGNPPERQG